MDVFRHHDIGDNHEPVTLARLFQNREEAVAAARRAQKRQSPVARAGDKVQMMGAVTAMQSAGHNKPNGSRSIVPALRKQRERRGTHRVSLAAMSKPGPPAARDETKSNSCFSQTREKWGIPLVTSLRITRHYVTAAPAVMAPGTFPSRALRGE